MYASVGMYAYSMYVYVYLYMYVYVCVGLLGSVFSICLYLFVCSVACYSILDPFDEIWTVAGDPDPI